MLEYRNENGNSNITGYHITETSITVEFGNQTQYRYDKSKIGENHFVVMCEKAESGQGLSSYISKNEKVRNGYTTKKTNITDNIMFVIDRPFANGK